MLDCFENINFSSTSIPLTCKRYYNYFQMSWDRESEYIVKKLGYFNQSLYKQLLLNLKRFQDTFKGKNLEFQLVNMGLGTLGLDLLDFQNIRIYKCIINQLYGPRNSLSKIQDLTISSSILYSFNVSLIQNNNLKRMCLSYTQISLLDFSQCEFPNLQVLDLSFNRLNLIDFSNCVFPSLLCLKLDHNYLKSISFENTKFYKVFNIHLHDNLLKEIIFPKHSIYFIKTLTIFNNKLTNINLYKTEIDNLQIDKDVDVKHNSSNLQIIVL